MLEDSSDGNELMEIDLGMGRLPPCNPRTKKLMLVWRQEKHEKKNWVLVKFNHLLDTWRCKLIAFNLRQLMSFFHIFPTYQYLWWVQRLSVSRSDATYLYTTSMEIVVADINRSDFYELVQPGRLRADRYDDPMQQGWHVTHWNPSYTAHYHRTTVW